MPWLIRKRAKEWCVYKQDEDGQPTGEALGCHATKGEAEDQIAALHTNVEEMKADLWLREYRDHKFAGPFPTVPTYDHVDTELLYKGDNDPFHVVVPIARIGEVSANKLVYDADLIAEIERQLPGIGGIRGHKSDSQFPLEDHDLIGHVHEGDTLWAKFYIPPGAQRDDLRRRKARGGGVATSIYGPFETREPLKNGSWRARGLELQRVDFGPPNQVALNLANGAFAVVSELTEDEQETDDMDRDQIIAELTIADLPKTLRDQIVAEYQTQQDDDQRVAELRTEISDKDNVIAELTQKVNRFEEAHFLTQVDGLIAEMVTVELLRPIVRRAVIAELGQERTEATAKTALEAYLDTDEYKQLAKAMVAEMAGPGAFVGAQRNAGNWREDLANRAEDLAREKGVKS